MSHYRSTASLHTSPLSSCSHVSWKHRAGPPGLTEPEVGLGCWQNLRLCWGVDRTWGWVGVLTEPEVGLECWQNLRMGWGLTEPEVGLGGIGVVVEVSYEAHAPLYPLRDRCVWVGFPGLDSCLPTLTQVASRGPARWDWQGTAGRRFIKGVSKVGRS